MQKHTHKHRHLVAIPAFLVMVGLSFAQGYIDVPPLFDAVHSNISVVDDQQDFTFDSGAFGVLYSGLLTEKAGNIRLDKGATTIESSGVLTVRSGETTITGVSGTLYIANENGEIVVAALTTPAYVAHKEQRMIVPVGMQWKFAPLRGMASLEDGFDDWMFARLPKVAPESFLKRKLSDIAQVVRPTQQLPELYEQQIGSPSVLESVLLPASAARLEERTARQALGAVHFAVTQGNAEALEEVLKNPVIQQVLATQFGKDTLVRLLPLSSTPLAMQLLQELISEEAVWAVASLHPDLVAITWSIFEPEVSVELQLVRVFMLPFAATAAADFPGFVFERHRLTQQAMLENLGDTTTFIEHVLTTHVPLVEKLHAKGYPKRALALRSSLSELTKGAIEQTPIMNEARLSLKQLDRIDLAPLPEKKVEEVVEKVSEEAEEVEELSPEEAEAVANQLLTDAGAVYSLNTAIAGFATNQVRVSDILFSTPTEDRTVSFTLNVVTKMVEDIEVNGNGDFPYSPTFDGFVTWIRQ